MARIDGVNPEEVDEYTYKVLQAQTRIWGDRYSTTWSMRADLPSFVACAGCGRESRLQD